MPRKPKTTQVHLCLCLDLQTTPPAVSTVGLYSSPAGSLPAAIGRALWLDLGRFEGFDFEDARENAILTINNHMPWLHWTLPTLTGDPDLLAPMQELSKLREGLWPLADVGSAPIVESEVASKPAEKVLREIREVLWPPEDPEQEWDSETIEHVAAIVGRDASIGSGSEGEPAESDAEEEALMALSARWPDSSSDLDELVDMHFAQRARTVNGQGTTEQLRFLTTEGGWTREKLWDMVSDLVEEES